MKQHFQAVMAVLGLIGLSTIAAAQERPAGPWAYTVEGAAVFQSKADFDAGDGAFSLDRWFLSAGVTYLWDERTMLGVSVGGGRTSYDFEDASGASSTEPWNTIEDFRVSVNARVPFSEKGTLFFIPTLRYNGEEGASSSDSRTWGLIAGASWRLSDSLTIGPGLGVFEQLEESTRVFPLLIIDWDITERWNLSTGRGLAASQGPGLTLSYALNDDWSLGVAGRYEEIDFRLDNTGPAPGGVGRDKAIPLVLNAAWDPNPGTSLGFFVGSEFGGSLELLDNLGNTVEERAYDPSFIAGASFRLRF